LRDVFQPEEAGRAGGAEWRKGSASVHFPYPTPKGASVKAIFSDVHANLEAFQAVLAAMAREPVTAVYNLGDTTGYGPNPIECLDLSMGLPVVLLGNNDQGILFDPDGF
jgi:hypothetical protein